MPDSNEAGPSPSVADKPSASLHKPAPGYLVAVQHTVGLVEETAKDAKVAGAAVAVAKAGGLAFDIVNVFTLGTEVAHLNERAAAAVESRSLSAEAYAQYKMILAGHVVGGTLDPTQIGDSIIVSGVYEQWARDNIADPALRAELRPGNLLDTLGLAAKTPEQLRIEAFYDALPDQPAKQTPGALRDVIAIKQQIKAEMIARGPERLRQGLVANPRVFKIGPSGISTSRICRFPSGMPMKCC